MAKTATQTNDATAAAADQAAATAGQATPITPPTDTTTGSTSPSGTTTTSPKIGVSTLTSTATPIAVVQPTASTKSDALAGTIASTADTFQADLDAKAAAAKTAKDSSLKTYLDSRLDTKTKGELTNSEYANTVDPAEAELKDINNQITAEQHSALRAEQALRKNPQGLYGGALEQAIQDIRDKSTSRLADLSVIQLARQGKYDSAKEIADRAVEAKFERDQANNEALQYSYEQNKDDFTVAEQHQFETAQADRNRKLDFEVYKEKAKYDQIIKQNDPLYRAQLAKAQQDLQTSGTIDLSKLTGTSIQKNSTALTALLGSSSIGQGTRTSIANVLGVINAGNDLADNNADGKFAGVHPLAGITGGIANFFGVRGDKQVANQGYLDAINLKTQQWASGASLTKEQIAMVNKLVPGVNDSDKQAKAKLNNLTNFMLTQTQSSLQSEGIGYTPEKVDYFSDVAATPANPLGLNLVSAAAGAINPLAGVITAANPLGL